MKVLLIHTKYVFKGGEDAVFEQEFRLLSQKIEVQSLVFQNQSGWRGLLQFIQSIWNVGCCQMLKRKVELFNPDIIHVHNAHFAVGSIVYAVAHKLNIPIVATLHNYRLLCPSGTLHKGSNLFTESLHTIFPWKAVWIRAYRNSFLQTFWLALSTWFHKSIGTWKKVDKYIVLTLFAKELFLHFRLALNEIQLVVKPNFVENQQLGHLKRGAQFLFVGRLSEEKGIRTLLETFNQSDSPLYIVGDGPMKADVIEWIESSEI